MADLTPIIKNFPEVGEVQEIKALTSGLINQTYLVKTADENDLTTFSNASTTISSAMWTCSSTTSKW